MNKKLITIIASSVAVLVIAVLAALYFTGTIKPDFSSKDEKEKTSSSVSETKDGAKDSETGEKGNKSSESGTISVKKADNVEASANDEFITVPVSITKNPGMVAGQVYIEYDTNSFDFVDCTAGDIFADCQSNVSDGVITCIIMDDITQDTVDSTKTGTLFNVSLKPKSGIKSGTYSLKITDDTKFSSIDVNYAYPTVTVGDIVIK